MLRTERPDYRRSKEAELLEGLRSRDPLALAETYHRTSPAAHACARRLLGGPRDAEALLTAVYADLWADPPETARLEGWVRSRCFRLASEHLRERDQAPASPSLTLLLPDLPRPGQASPDPVEQALTALPERERRAVLLAHDQGMPTAAQDDPGAGAALDRALMTLAGPGEGVDDGTGGGCENLPGMADWTLGLLEADRAARISAEIADRPACAARSRALRRGRRRLEGLPPAPDMGQRVMASVLAGTPAVAPGDEAPAAPDTASPPAALADDALGATAARSILDEGPASPPISPAPGSSPPWISTPDTPPPETPLPPPDTPSPAPATAPASSPEPATPPPSSPEPATPPPSSLDPGTPPPATPPPAFPEALIPFAPLPSSLDEEVAAPHEPREDELAFLSPEPLTPERPSVERLTPDRPDDAAGGEDAGDAGADTRLLPGDEQWPTDEKTPTDEDTDNDVLTEEVREGFAGEERARGRGPEQREGFKGSGPGASAEAPPRAHEPMGVVGGADAAGARPLSRQLLNVLAIVLVLAAGGALGLLIGFLLVGGR